MNTEKKGVSEKKNRPILSLVTLSFHKLHMALLNNIVKEYQCHPETKTC
jgi:hypothetical protein